MIGEIGHFCLIVALMLALAQGILPLVGAQKGRTAWMAVAQPAAQGQFLFVAIAYVLLTTAFVNNDFSMLVVAQHSNSQLPTPYRIAAVWGGHEGSMLMWVLMLCLWGVAVSIFSQRLPSAFVARVLGVMGLLGTGFLSFLLFTSNPFVRLLPAAAEGRDLNPLLQDPGMVIHPPMLYMGYVGFSVAFAFAIAALLTGRLDATWARWSRPWTTIAWMFLTLGIAIGSWWAYYELGWGGWWFWDPVENASFLPWLVGTGLIHSLAVTEKRGAFRSWTVLLAIFAFSFSLLGTFLVRSGVLTSVHAFATDPKRGVFILVFLIAVVGSSLVLFAARAPKVGLGGKFSAVSRESMLLANNVLFSVAAASVMLGTLYPLLLDALELGKISVGPPYFEAVFVPLMAPAVFLMGIGPLTRWKEASVPELAKRLRWALGAAVLATAVSLVAGGSLLSSFGVLLAAWVAGTTVLALLERTRNLKGSFVQRLAQVKRVLPRGEWGMLLAHFGIGVFIFGVTMVKTWEAEKDVKMQPGESATLGGYTFRMESIGEYTGPNYLALRAAVKITRGDQEVTTMHPEKRMYTAQGMPMTEAGIDAGFTRDLYVSIGENLGGEAFAVRLQVKPFIDWIWGGAFLMAMGGLLAATDRRYRLARKEARAADAALAGAKA
ncbi:heme lyase CcmF/NrfE family subunit [Ramlibacter montanisoli]|uniref:Heme lyase CcmF/NrfE family subunit n=1 Tax=Ramlibacter montanisoli TaxID=2732512 RepID=A0A849KH05_9BURK|nr:heme lyase CcmF/NrfE family subunit [Ramlibacter montanisoli]NNU43931.1 heme lyase CcmF/NrfE family subunit [Ramlibacter montanisoli]